MITNVRKCGTGRIASNGGPWEFYPGILLKSLSSYMAFLPVARTLILYLTGGQAVSNE